MSFKLIKAAQATIALGKNVTVAEQVAKILGDSSVELKKSIFKESFDESAYQITPEDYSNWLAAVMDIAAEEGVSVGRKTDFMRVAMDYVLDNDAKFDFLGGDTEGLKSRVAQTLWQTYKASKAHGAVADGVNSTIRQAQEEEQAFAAMSADAKEMEEGEVHKDNFFKRGQGVNVTVQGKQYPGMVVDRKLNDQYVVRVKLANRTVDVRAPYGAMQASEDEQESGFIQAFDQANGVEDEQSSCPYAAGTLRAALWNKYNKTPKSIVKRVAEDEELIDIEDFNPEEYSGDNAGVVSDADDSIELSADELADRIVGDVGEIDLGDEDDSTDVSELESRIADLEAQIADLKGGDSDQEEPEGDELNIDYDSLGNDRPGAAGVIGVSVPATAKEDEEKGDMFRQAITAPREKLTQAVKSVEEEGATAWRGLQLPRNPHPKKTQAFRAWEKGMKNAAKDALGLKDKPVIVTSKQRRKN